MWDFLFDDNINVCFIYHRLWDIHNRNWRPWHCHLEWARPKLKCGSWYPMCDIIYDDNRYGNLNSNCHCLRDVTYVSQIYTQFESWSWNKTSRSIGHDIEHEWLRYFMYFSLAYNLEGKKGESISNGPQKRRTYVRTDGRIHSADSIRQRVVFLLQTKSTILPIQNIWPYNRCSITCWPVAVTMQLNKYSWLDLSR